jgi:hypothetical protein
LSTRSGTTKATPRHSRMCPERQLLRSLSDGLSVTLPNKVYSKCHVIILTSMTGLRWASMVIPFMEQERIVEGEQIQSASEKCSTLVDHFFSTASMIDVFVGGSRGKGGTVCLGIVGGSGGKGGTVRLGKDSVKRFLARWIWTEVHITCSMGSASGSGSTQVLIARESCTGMYSLSTFSSSSWSLGTFSKIFMIGLPMMILCERFLGRSKM